MEILDDLIAVGVAIERESGLELDWGAPYTPYCTIGTILLMFLVVLTARIC